MYLFPFTMAFGSGFAAGGCAVGLVATPLHYLQYPNTLRYSIMQHHWELPSNHRHQSTRKNDKWSKKVVSRQLPSERNKKRDLGLCRATHTYTQEESGANSKCSTIVYCCLACRRVIVFFFSVTSNVKQIGEAATHPI